MAVRLLAPLSALLLIAAIANAGRSVDQTQLPPTYMPSGEQTYKQYCAACHGADAKGVGPLASLLKTLPPDLTTLAKRHLGKFPYDYVANGSRVCSCSTLGFRSSDPAWCLWGD